jgi:hypothetical protein
MVVRWLAVRQARVRVSARHPMEVPPADSCEDMEMGLSKCSLRNDVGMDLLYKKEKEMQTEWHMATKPLSITRERGQCGDHGTFLVALLGSVREKNPTGKNIRHRSFPRPARHTIRAQASKLNSQPEMDSLPGNKSAFRPISLDQ